MTFGRKSFLIRFFIALIFVSLISPTQRSAIAATDHSGASLRTSWTPLTVQSNESLELPFMPINIDGFVNDARDRWTTTYNFSFDWKSDDFLSPNPLSGYIQIGLYRKSGSIYFGNLDFYTANAIAVRKNPLDSNTVCELDPWNNVRIRTINKVETRTAICWRAIQISPGVIYTFNVKPDRNLGEGWWYGSLTNNFNSSEITVGSIKLYSPKNELSFTNFSFYRNYTGEAVACDSVPISDTYVWPIRKSAGETSKFITSSPDSCVRTVIEFDKDKGAYAIRYGGSNPLARTKKNSSNPQPGTAEDSSATKPNTPSFSSVNFSGNTLNILVNLGSSASSRPEKVYLVAPKLGISSSNPLPGTIGGNTARWSLEFDKILAGTMIPLEVVGEKNGVKSDVLSGSYQAPTILAEINRAPATPKNFKARIVGNSALMTVDVLYNSNSRAEKVFLFSSSLGISKAKAIRAEMVADKAVIELPIKVSMSGKKYPVTIYAINALGESKPLSATLSIPSLPKTPQVSAAIPKPSTPATITCIRSNQTRTFAGLKCPPGWSLP